MPAVSAMTMAQLFAPATVWHAKPKPSVAEIAEDCGPLSAAQLLHRDFMMERFHKWSLYYHQVSMEAIRKALDWEDRAKAAAAENEQFWETKYKEMYQHEWQAAKDAEDRRAQLKMRFERQNYSHRRGWFEWTCDPWFFPLGKSVKDGEPGRIRLPERIIERMAEDKERLEKEYGILGVELA